MNSPFVMVIFGATGDLTARKLMPALYRLLEKGVIPDKFFVVGVARRFFSHIEFRNLMKEEIVKNQRSNEEFENIWSKLEKNLYYQQGLFEEKKPYQKLVKLLKSFDTEIGACLTRFFYLATPPQNYSEILTHLDSSRLSEGCGQGSNKWTRVLIEKPFGKDLEAAQKLEEQLAHTFEEKQIYRIDHYLAKDTVQNILVFRFANKLFKSIWDKDHIDNIQITLLEESGIGKRGKLYDGLGALLDVAQNHLMAILAYVAMEEPENFSAEATREERIKVLEKIRCIDPEDVEKMVVRGQYGRGMTGERNAGAFREEKDINADSDTETYVAFKLFIDNDRWQDMPFYFRTGKRMKTSVVSIDIQFKNPLSRLFSGFKFSREAHANTLRIRIQPGESINFRFFAKSPGLSLELAPVNMEFSYAKSFEKQLFDSYQKLLLDAMRGDQTLFATSRGFSATWEFISRIIHHWKNSAIPQFPNYPAGSWGPEAADELIEKDGRHWLLH